MSEQEKYSFSKLESFHNCKRAYYHSYVEGNRGGDNIYSFLGTLCHELTQAIIEGKETNESAIEKFKEGIEDADLLGLIWMSEKIKQNYIDCITHFFENFSATKGDNISIEEYFEVDIMGAILRGYIDLYYFINGELHIIDLKTSSKFSAKDLIHKQRQLILYAYALEKKYPDIKIKLYFNMLKYANRKGKLIERNKLDLFDEYEDGLVEVYYTKELKQDLEHYVKETVSEITALDRNIESWSMGYDPENGFFCKNLCSYRENCIKNI